VTVYKRGNTWTYHIEVTVNGKREQFKRSGFATRDDAKRAERKRLTEIDGGQRLGAARLTVGDYLQGWLYRYERSGSRKRGTVYTTRGQVETHLLPRIGGVMLAKLSRSHVSGLVGDLHTDAGLSAKTVRNIIGTLRKALSDAVRDGIVPFNCAADVDLPKAAKFEPVTWSQPQSVAFLQYADATAMPLRAAWWLALTGGLRRGELCGLRWADVDFAHRKVHVRNTRLQNGGGLWADTPKSRTSRRTVTLGVGAFHALVELRDTQRAWAAMVGEFGHDYVFVMPDDGRPVQPNYVTRWWHRSVQAAKRAGLPLPKSAGLPAMRLHDGRHTHFTHLAELGVPLHVIRARAGHESIVTTERFYIHATEAADAAAVDRFDAAFTELGSGLVGNSPEHATHTAPRAD